MKVSFTTLSCPEWTWEKIVDTASSLGYDGLEIRGIEGEMYLPKARPFLMENIDNTINTLKEKGLKICCLDTSCVFHSEGKYNDSISEGKAAIDLAQKLGVPFIRVFGNDIPDMNKKEEIISRVALGLETLGLYAEDKGVTVLLETHGDFSSSERILEVLEKVNAGAIGVLWDINHPYKAFNEPIEFTYSKLGKYIKHIHVKDSKGMGKGAKLCLVGQGDLPVADVVELLKNSGYDGWLSLEWEKKWHPDLEEPEVAIPEYIKYVRNYI